MFILWMGLRRKYKDFLDSITPAEWFEAQASKLQRRKDAMLAEWQARRCWLPRQLCPLFPCQQSARRPLPPAVLSLSLSPSVGSARSSHPRSSHPRRA